MSRKPIDYVEASPQVRAVFDDIKRTRGVPDASNSRRYCLCATGFEPVGPIAVTCRITSPSLAHTKCGAPAGSV